MKIDQKTITKLFEKDPNTSAFGKPLDIVKRMPDLISPGPVLDLGAGDGRHAIFLAEHGFQVTAVDIAVAGIEKLQRFATARGLNIETVVADAAKYRIDRRYDTMLVILLFQFLDEAASLRLMNEMKKQTTPGGLNVIEVFTKTGDRADLDAAEDPTAFYPEDGWLKKFYADWNIIDHSLDSAPLMKNREDGTPSRSMVEKIIARKPR